MKRLPVGRGLFALVSTSDYPELSQYLWVLKRHTKHLSYAFRYERRKPKYPRRYRKIRLHNQIMQPPSGFSVDHVSGDALDNRRCNLRLATQRQQAQNMRKHLRGASRFKGVTYCPFTRHWKLRKPWRARIRVNGKLLQLGCYALEKDAARAYNIGARKYFGVFARPNIL